MNFDHLDNHIAQGRLWRAKEICQGRLASQEFNLELLRRYGEVLLLMGDNKEAGKYLFASGYRDEKYQQAIELFLQSNSREDKRQFIKKLPTMISRHSYLSEFIASEDFKEHGWAGYDTSSLFVPKNSKKTELQNSRIRNLLGIVFIAWSIAAFFIGTGFILYCISEAISYWWPAFGHSNRI